jgi:NTE family protein
LAAALEERRFEKGAFVCREGEPDDRFFVVASGELEVTSGSPPSVIRRLGPGEFAGEIALLTGGPRSATIRVARAARLWILGAGAFQQLVAGDEKAVASMVGVLSRRLASASPGRGMAARRRFVGVLRDPGVRGSSVVAEALARFLCELRAGPVALVRLESIDRGAPAHLALPTLDEIHRAPERVRILPSPADAREPARLVLGVRRTAADDLIEGLNALFERLAPSVDALVLDLGAAAPALAHAAAQTCDALVKVMAKLPSGPCPESTYRVINLYNESSAPLPISDCDPYVLPADPSLVQGAVEGARRLCRDLWSPAAPPLRRLARKLSGSALGLALGGGAAFGISSVGVLQVLERNGLVPDLIAGTSFGGLVAIGYAAGLRPERMIQLARMFGNKRTMLSALDLSLGKPSLMAGERAAAVFRPMLGAVRDFEHLELPCRVVAADIETGERVALGAGSLERCARASWAVPMIWPPVVIDDRPLVDGGVVDPVPAAVVREMGADLCVAVNVVPRLERGVESFLSRAYRGLRGLSPFARGNRATLPNLFDLIMNSLQTLQHELGSFQASFADVQIQPRLSDFTWIDFHRAEELIERGAEAAERALPAIRTALEARRGPP